MARGDPDKCDANGNSALHWASQNGHISCVNCLVDFGVNLWALDNSLQTAREVAAMKGQQAIIRILDAEDIKQSSKNKKHVQYLKEKATRNAQKRIKAASNNHGDKDKRKKGLIRMLPKVTAVSGHPNQQHNQHSSFNDLIQAKTTSALKPAKTGVAQKITKQREDNGRTSEMADTNQGGGGGGSSNLSHTPLFNRRMLTNGTSVNGGLKLGWQSESDLTKYNNQSPTSEDGSPQRTANSLGRHKTLRTFIPRGKTHTAFEEYYNSNKNQTNFNCNNDDKDSANGSEPASGASSVSSRKSQGKKGVVGKRGQMSPVVVKKRNSYSAVETFLAAYDLLECLPFLKNEKIDMSSLFMLSENDLKELQLPMGYRKKLIEALRCHQTAFKEAGQIHDSWV